MNVSNKVTLLGAAVAALFATAASAQIILPNTIGTAAVVAVNGKVYAREISPSIQLTGPFTAQSILGIGTSSTQTRYLKFRLSNATFATQIAATDLVGLAGAGAPTAVPPGVAATFGGLAVADGGTAGSNNVIFQTTATANAQQDGFQLTIPTGVNLVSTSGPVTLTYEVFETLVQAQAGAPVLYTRAANIASFSPAVNFTSVAVQNQTATAISSYLNVVGGAAAAIARVANLNLANAALTTGVGTCLVGAANVPFQPNGVACAVVGTVLNPALANTLSVAGDFSAAASAASVTLGGSQTSQVGATAASAVTATGATIPLTAAQAAGFAANAVLYAVNGTTALPISAYTSTFTGTANAGYTIGALGPLTTGNIARDGSQLDSPWATTTTGFISRFFLTQTTPATVPYTVIVRNLAGLVVGGTLTGTLSPNRTTLITLASLLPADTTAFPGPYQVTFNIAAANTATQGTYVLTSPTGSVTNTPLFTVGVGQ